MTRCFLQFAPINTASCVRHRPVSRVIHRLQLCIENITLLNFWVSGKWLSFLKQENKERDPWLYSALYSLQSSCYPWRERYILQSESLFDALFANRLTKYAWFKLMDLSLLLSQAFYSPYSSRKEIFNEDLFALRFSMDNKSYWTTMFSQSVIRLSLHCYMEKLSLQRRINSSPVSC